MSNRIGYSDDEDFPGQFGMWQANCQRSLHGRDGQKSLRELEAALIALPNKRLIARELFDGSDCCAVGALVRAKRITPKNDPERDMDMVGTECGMPRLVAWKVVELNDMDFSRRWAPETAEYGGGNWVSYTPEERYAAMLSWVRSQLAAPQKDQAA